MTTTTTSGQDSIYTGRTTNWWMLAVIAVLLMPLPFWELNGWQDIAEPIAIFAIGMAIYALTGAHVRTTVGPLGVSVHLGTLGWPHRTYRLDQIERAEAIDHHSWYRVFDLPWTPRRTCWINRSGPALRLRLTNGRTVTVTTPDPHAAVAAINNANASPDRK